MVKFMKFYYDVYQSGAPLNPASPARIDITATQENEPVLHLKYNGGVLHHEKIFFQLIDNDGYFNY
jgi:hypothetical protein